MALRAKTPEQIEKRLKLFLFGAAGVGKSTAAIQFEKSYIIDAEKGLENDEYVDLIIKSNSVVFSSTDAYECIQEIQSLRTEDHDFRTLVIDSITPIYGNLLDEAELKVGSEFGRHYGEANKTMRRLVNLILNLDMNVIITAHSKTEYGENLIKLGHTFDGWKKLDYMFDLVIELQKRGERRVAVVKKTRISKTREIPSAFPDGDTFEWTYEEFVNRYGKKSLERKAEKIVLATSGQVDALVLLLETIKLPDGTTEKWLKKAESESFSEMTNEQIQKCIEFCEKKINI